MTERKISLGICAMAKKVNSKHMQQILFGLKQFDEFELITFTEDLIFNTEVEKWPVVDSMIVFFSNGFPYSKVLSYIKLRNPFLINDFEMQKIFWDRRIVSQMLRDNNIPTPNDILIDRGEVINNDQNKCDLNSSAEIKSMIRSYQQEYPGVLKINDVDGECVSSEEEEDSDKVKEDINSEVDKDLKEYDDYITYKGKKLTKPFVEKPVNGDDHNIYIYYPMSHGGGHKRLFRKTLDLCSLYYPNQNNIRRDKSYIYEEFLQTDGFDIKVYTVGETYAHAEARKSPCLDGKVQRTNEGKEVRYPVNLTLEEKEIARKIVLIFKQNVCGFDILRANGKSYVCDVNGWSFVKGNKKYYEDCVILIRKIILTKIDMELYMKKPINLRKRNDSVYKGMVIPNRDSSNNDMELKSIVAVFRHSDRSPKQKMKLVVDNPLILSLFDKFHTNTKNEIKLKKPTELLEVLNIVKTILNKEGFDESHLTDLKDNFYIKLFQIKLVLEKNLNFEGMTRKIQVKPLKIETDGTKKKVTEALLIMKWGGNITHAGIEQAKTLGSTFRTQLYPTGNAGDDLLRLHNTYRHDLKCYSSEEGRCLKTAAAFLQGLLQLEGHLIPIISSMVRRDDNVNQLLDVNCSEVESVRKSVKHKLNSFCNFKGDLKEKYKSEVGDEINDKHETKLVELIDHIGNFYTQMKKVYELMGAFVNHLKTMLSFDELEHECSSYFVRKSDSILSRKSSGVDISNKGIDSIHENERPKKRKNSAACGQTSLSSINSKSTTALNNGGLGPAKDMDCEDEKIVLIFKRYVKLHQDFYNGQTKKFEISKIPDIYDNIKYDIIHNKTILNKSGYELFNHINLLANFVMPLEYGIKNEEKYNIGLKIIKPLLNKIVKDLIWWDSNYETNHYLVDLENAEKSYSGLDQDKLNLNDIKSSWRHIKTRFYFTSASHLYSLFNALLYGMNSYLVKDDANEIWNIFDLDYCSHIVFRLFENLSVSEDNDKRYHMEIIMSPGSNKDPKEADKKHMVSVSPWIIVNDNLSFKEVKKFFDFVLKSEAK